MAFDLFGKPQGQYKQLPTKTPQQSQAVNQLLQQLMPQLQQSFDFEPIAQAATNRFNQQTLPGIGERFAALDGQRSSGYSQALANAQRDLQLGLAGQQQQYGLQQQGNLANLFGATQQPQFENIYEEGEQNPFLKLLELAGHAAAAYGTGGASVPFSASMLGGPSAGNQDYSQLQGFFKNLPGPFGRS